MQKILLFLAICLYLSTAIKFKKDGDVIVFESKNFQDGLEKFDNIFVKL